jgi:hypothetical protein
LNEVVNKGGSLFFDCPPLHYRDQDECPIECDPNHKAYYVIVDKEGKQIRPNSPKVVPNMTKVIDKSNGKHIQV